VIPDRAKTFLGLRWATLTRDEAGMSEGKIQHAPEEARPSKRWSFAISLRYFLVFITVLIVWLGWSVERSRREHAAIKGLQRLHVEVRYEHRYDPDEGEWFPLGQPSGPKLLREIVGDELFTHANAVNVYRESGGSITDDKIRKLTRYLEDLPRLRELRIDRVDAITDESLERLAGLSKLEHLALEAPHLTANGFAQLARLHKLKSLALSQTLDDEGLKMLQALKDLRRLQLFATNVSDDGMAALADNTSIRHLQLLSNSRLTGASIQYIRQMKQLELLELLGRGFGDETLKHLAHHPRLTRLEIHESMITDAGLAHLPTLPQLRHLCLASNKITDQGIADISRLTGLEWLELRDTQITDAALDQLATMSSLTRVYLFQNENVTRQAGLKLQTRLPRCAVTVN
jgi:hypothetical protein